MSEHQSKKWTQKLQGVSSKKFVAANGERIKDLGEKAIPFKSVEGVHRCIKFRSANVVKP